MTSQVYVARWNDLETDRPMAQIARKRIIGEHVMVSRVELEKGFRVPTHAHENEQLAMVMSGKIAFLLDEGKPTQREEVLTGGEVLVIPPNCPHAAHAIEDTVVLDVFSPPSETTGVDR